MRKFHLHDMGIITYSYITIKRTVKKHLSYAFVCRNCGTWILGSVIWLVPQYFDSVILGMFLRGLILLLISEQSEQSGIGVHGSLGRVV